MRAVPFLLAGKPAPPFTLRRIDTGETVTLEQLKGKPLVVNFWATWCGPCRQEMPLLDQLYGKYKQAGLVMLSVNVDENAEPAIEMAMMRVERQLPRNSRIMMLVSVAASTPS